MKLICKLLTGSHLYGTNTETSDTDYKGVYLPKLNQYLLQDISKTITHNTGKDNIKNSSTDIDDQLFSLNYFITLGLQGETNVLDMLHCPNNWEEVSSPIWEDLKSKRHLFYSKNLKSYVSYCRKQAQKYSLKGSRLDVAQQIITFCKNIISRDKLTSNIKGHKIIYYVQELPKLEYTNVIITLNEDGSIDNQKSYYEIFTKKFCFNDFIESIECSIQKFYSEYGQRAELAKNNENIDWKSISHAFRACFQLKEIYETHNLTYPLKDAGFLKNIKQGKLHWINDGISTYLDTLIDEIKILAENSNFPESPNKGYWNTWLIDTIKTNFSI